ncbi:hypothetical protein PLANPX_3261 [Lacipirellula parvula]|uniref:Uncharacterized protein n=1 Tax=Lacipirellula parvula TaxID=2650471 RepID=A0A5K7XL24_9BACT|nr:hypothetical protein PLANPX_3261 [Lacipirellula parvula]
MRASALLLQLHEADSRRLPLASNALLTQAIWSCEHSRLLPISG